SSDLTQIYLCVFSDDTANVEKQLHSDYAKEKEIQILNEMCTLIVSRSYETLGLINTENGKYQIYAAQNRDWFSQKKLEGDFDELTFHAANELAYDEEAKELLMNATLSGITGYFSQRPDTSYSFTYRGRTHESYRWKRAEYSYLKDDKTNIIFCTQDIHSKKMEEEHLARLAEKERQIHQEKMAFFANMSHEIRTPMNAILNLSELLLRKDLPLDVEQDISTIYEIGNGLLGIINSLLSFSKLDTGNIQLTTGTYSPATMCSDICSIISARLSKKSLHFSLIWIPPFQDSSSEMRCEFGKS
ncbi:histidine kinase dimerization/phospho-acceptor domain-containing protein, partial [Anaerostipes sp. CAG:276]|uniref:histidine kinase dimerization/phospho-acceptor domain-containing protein n=3 Tax=Lachnospiraceae TaxID=186803 RepID=UPI0025860D54